MVNLLSKDQLSVMSPEGRVKNGYESLYYRTGSGDPEVDEVLRAEMLQSFKEHDVVLADNPEPEKLRDVMLHAARESTKELQRSPLTPEQEQDIVKSFDKLSGNQPRFYETTFDSFERLHHGEPADFTAQYERDLEANGGVPPWEMEMTEESIEAMQAEFMDRDMEEHNRNLRGERVPRTVLAPDAVSRPKAVDDIKAPKKAPLSGLSYAAHVPGAVAPVKTSAYAHIKQEEAAATEQKNQGKYDREFEAHVRGKSGASKFTAGDSYGFDEPEDDGPEL